MILQLMFIVASTAPSAAAADYTTPTRALKPDEYPVFVDDHELRGMEVAIARQLERYRRKGLSGTIRFGNRTYPLTRVRETLKAFNRLAQAYRSCRSILIPTQLCRATFNYHMRRDFDVYVPDLSPGDPRYGEPREAFFTGYATHTLQVDQQLTTAHPYPIYSLPPPNKRGLTREEIDYQGGLNGLNLELAYGNNLFDLYLLHIEGSGFAQRADGSGFYLTYDGTNNKRWNWISKYMLDQGYISNPSVAAQRKFLRLNPDKAQEIFSTCPSYVYFKPSAQAPMGNDLVSLTDNRSLATDYKLYSFKGVLTYVETERAQESDSYNFELEDQSQVPFRSFSRFFLDQDTGGAITGKARADLYFGVGTYAEFAANFQANKGRIFFLMLKH